MKKLLLLAMLLPAFANGQSYWRRLTITNNTGISASGSSFNQTSANLYYELKNNYAITNWSGAHFQANPNVNWFSSQTAITKKYGQFNFGVGVQFGAAGIGVPTSTYGITTLSYQFKL